ncbi:MAG TPA: Ig-like domain-containing protein [Paraburkholderia sp.]|nr:Ig-like domain-containing protein [Paraburkholderia sp.]
MNTTTSLATDGRSPVKVKVQPGAKYLLVDENGTVAPENVTVSRVGDDLEVIAEGDSSPSLVLEGYFTHPDETGLYGVAEDGQLYEYTPTNATGSIYALSDGGTVAAALGGSPLGSGAPYLENAHDDNGFAALPLFLLGGAAAAIGGIAAALSGGDDNPPQPAAVKLVAERVSEIEVIDNVGSTQRSLKSGDSTDDPTPEFIGRGVAGHTVTIYDGNTVLGTTTVDAEGVWRFTPPELADGVHNLSITQVGPDTLESEATSIAIIIDTVAPDAPQISSVVDDVEPGLGQLTSGQPTNDSSPTFNGTGEPGATINVYANGTLIGSTTVIGTATADASGNWSYTPSTALADGTHVLTTQVTDVAGNRSAMSDALTVKLDTSTVAVRIGALTDDVGSVTGPIAQDGVTDDTRPTLHVYVNGELEAALMPGGHTRFCVAKGTYSLEAYAGDAPLYAGKANPRTEIDLEAGRTYFIAVSENGTGEPMPYRRAQAERVLQSSREQIDILNRASAVVPCGNPEPNAEPPVTLLKFELDAAVLFEFAKGDSSAITPEGRGELQKIAAKVRALPPRSVTRVEVRGHADPIGSDTFNVKLSKARARTISQVLSEAGIAPELIFAEGLGSRSIAVRCSPNGDREKRIRCNAPNRRVEISVKGARPEGVASN